ncbi:hypothetical protein AVEN_191806-1 [Araneus ventricosus]|uniref:Uncharacterized protein n=1 Tax=Araneus ventricosus TaxID=182803 RepID=A0A4Y2U5I6_ARAVE|nr:hypothetical protein AVEN_191806-1 [Araneus ventricosus]
MRKRCIIPSGSGNKPPCFKELRDFCLPSHPRSGWRSRATAQLAHWIRRPWAPVDLGFETGGLKVRDFILLKIRLVCAKSGVEGVKRPSTSVKWMFGEGSLGTGVFVV